MYPNPVIRVLCLGLTGFLTSLGYLHLHSHRCCQSGMQEPGIDSTRAHGLGPHRRNGPTQAGPIMSGSLSDLLNGSFSDTHFSDGSTTGYCTGANSRPTLSLDFHLNDRNSGFHMHSDYPSPPLWSPFNQRNTATAQPDHYLYNFAGSTLMQSQVSTPSSSSLGANTLGL